MSTGAPIEKNVHIYDGWNLIGEMNVSGSLIREYVWGLDLSDTEHGAGGVGGLLLVWDGTDTYYTTYDGNGNVTGLVDPSDGSTPAVYEYDPFGNLLRATGLMAKSNPFRFSTKYQDDETGLVYYGYRWYDPVLGRWPNRDPIDEQGSLNVYSFIQNDTVHFWDMLGREKGTNKPPGDFPFDPDYGWGPDQERVHLSGPDVTDELWGTLINISQVYIRSPFIQKCKACVAIRDPNQASGSWDIEYLHAVGFGSIAVGVNNGRQTVGFQKRAYHASAVNYAMWGLINRLCYETFGGRLPGGTMIPWSLQTTLAAVTYQKTTIRRQAEFFSLPHAQAYLFTVFGYTAAFFPHPSYEGVSIDYDASIAPGWYDSPDVLKWHWTHIHDGGL